MPLLQYRASGLQDIQCFDHFTSIALLLPVPDFRQMAYVSIDDMVADAWISPATVELKLPVAIATIRNKTDAGF